MSEFADHLHELLAGFGAVDIRRMFGGQGVFRDGLMFGLIADDVLYLKTDAANLAQFEALDLEPFSYVRQGRVASLSYRRAPDVCLEDRQQAVHWAQLAFDAALRARKPAARKPSAKAAITPVRVAPARPAAAGAKPATTSRTDKSGKRR
ncbi:MAG: TfoX/Sxy family protein [Burkholderiaceae bacterium]